MPGAARSRTAKPAEATSDVTRARGVLAASLAGAAAVLAAFALTSEISEWRSPGALSVGHVRAGLECQSCHAKASAELACSGCHTGQESRRSGHHRLMARGAMSCTSCHPGHRHAASLAFAPDSGVRLELGSSSVVLDETPNYRPQQATRLPLVRKSACQHCHVLESGDDAAALCARAASGPYQACFDEHRAAGEAPAERDAAWEASRALLRSGVGLPGKTGQPWGILAFGLLTATLVWAGRRWLGARRSRVPAIEPAVVRAAARVRLPQVDATTCLGCSACVDACPFDVLELMGFVAVVARPDACCGLSLCEQRCPNGSLVVREGDPIDDRPRLSGALESLDVPGLYLAGDLTGLSLIRNAINQGAHVAHHIADGIALARQPAPPSASDYDLLIVGTGPAGLSALVEAKRRGLSAVALEQGSLAESIKSFPRHKLVLDHGVAADTRASLWLQQCEKEELVLKWTQIARRERLPILEEHRVKAVERLPRAGRPCFHVSAATPAGEIELWADHVLLALGKRGSPRKLGLPIPEHWKNHVHYSLLDARPFAHERVLVVGLGDSAMEAAHALSTQPGCRVTVCARARDFTRGKRRNIDTLKHLVGEGRLELLLDSSVTAFSRQGVELSVGGQPRILQVDSVFVLIGAELSWAFLEAVGVTRGAIDEDSDPETR
jgi:thioredoxin reductase/NAD-dependent dihydropyrimidine dehydrogenase PreA subunit